MLNITNKVNDARLKILIWNTPKLSLGSYLAISSATGFVISYLITSNIARNNYVRSNKQFRYKTDVQVNKTNNIYDHEDKAIYQNTLFERDINDPSPTLNASFRIINNSSREIKYPKNIVNEEERITNSTKYSGDLLDENDFIDDKVTESYTSQNDWDDDTYANW